MALKRDAYRRNCRGGGGGGGGEAGKLGPHKQMTLAIIIIAYISTSICLLRFTLFA